MPSIIDDVGSAIESTFFHSGAGSFSSERLPMSFTSTERLRSIDSSTFDSTVSVLAARARTPNAAQPLAVIEMMVNPRSIGWKQGKRIVKRDTQEGSTYFHFNNSQGENNDILTLDFSGNTGNIDSRSSIRAATGVYSNDSGADTGAIKKAIIWHNLWNLTREKILLPDYVQNKFYIMYSSPIISYPIMLIGFFSNVLQWTDSADKPFSKDYSFSFTVQETSPPLNTLLQKIQTVVIDPSLIQTENIQI